MDGQHKERTSRGKPDTKLVPHWQDRSVFTPHEKERDAQASLTES